MDPPESSGIGPPGPNCDLAPHFWPLSRTISKVVTFPILGPLFLGSQRSYSRETMQSQRRHLGPTAQPIIGTLGPFCTGSVRDELVGSTFGIGRLQEGGPIFGPYN